MTWLLCPRMVAASDGGWGRAAMMRGDAADVVHSLRGHDDGSGLTRNQLPDILRPAPGSTLDDLSVTRFGLLVASDTARAAIEARDPAAHRFWRLRGSLDAPLRFGLIVGRSGRAIVAERSSVRTDPAMPEFGLPRRTVLHGTRVAVDRARLPDAHLWWDHALGRPVLLCSDALAGGLDAPKYRCGA